MSEYLQIFRVLLFTAPTPAHPRFHDWQHIGLAVWLLADSADKAKSEALRLIEGPAFMAPKQTIVQRLSDLNRGTLNEADQMLLKEAMEGNIGASLHVTPAGTPDAEFFCEGGFSDAAEGDEWKNG